MKALVIATEPLHTAARFTHELQRAGYRVAVLCDRSDLARSVRNAEAAFINYPHARFWSFRRAFTATSPDVVFCMDEGAIGSMHSIHRRVRHAAARKQGGLARLIVSSLGDPEHYGVVASKTRQIALAQSLGMRAPKQMVVKDPLSWQSRIDELGLPLVVKIDGTSGGRGVRICKTREEASAAVAKFLRPGVAGWLSGRRPPKDGDVVLQQYIRGRPANRAVACRDGKVLAGMSVEVVVTSHSTGPATVVRLAHHAEMDQMAATMAHHLGLSGLCGFDFMIDEAGSPWLIEVNARVTPSAYYGFDLSLLRALDPRLVVPSAPAGGTSSIDCIALFPNEWLRDPESPHLASAYLDVPIGDPQLAKHIADYAARAKARSRHLANLRHCARLLRHGAIERSHAS